MNSELDKHVKHHIRMDALMMYILRFYLLLGFAVFTAIPIIFLGYVCKFNMGFPDLFNVRDDQLFYGAITILLLTGITRGAVVKLFIKAWKQLTETHKEHVADIYRSIRGVPSYYED